MMRMAISSAHAKYMQYREQERKLQSGDDLKRNQNLIEDETEYLKQTKTLLGKRYYEVLERS